MNALERNIAQTAVVEREPHSSTTQLHIFLWRIPAALPVKIRSIHQQRVHRRSPRLVAEHFNQKVYSNMPPNIWVPSSRAAASRFSSHRAEALSLYREILRTAKHFHWCDEHGIPWNQRLRKQAREEFEAAREESDPLILARLLVTGRDCVEQIQQRFNVADKACWERIKRDTNNRWSRK